MTIYTENLSKLGQDFEKTVDARKGSLSADDVEKLRVEWLGRKGKITQQFENLKKVPKSDLPSLGKQLNQLRQHIEATVVSLKEEASELELRQNLARPPLDVTLPVHTQYQTGALHPVSLVRMKMYKIFQKRGFAIFDGPEIDSEHFNFNALNIPDNHPARDMQDTFFLKNHKNMVLRTHTSNVQIHSMLQHKPPLRFISPGRVYRVDNDATHSPMFHQIECVIVDQDINFSHLKGMIQSFIDEIFGSQIRTRFRPSYFPFVEPGAEVDIYGTNGWLEIGGCGMIHPNVFEAVNYDSEIYSGYAFGFGLDRMAMLLYGLDDLRLLFEGDHKYHSQFPIF